MIFVDASAMISMMTGESDADSLADRLGAERQRLCSAISVWETIAGLCRTHTFSVPSALHRVERSQVRRHR
jgi:ribonuclease VapC